MSQRRMLNKSISISTQVDSVPERGQLLFTWMIPHGDDEGRLIGSPKYIKGIVVPLKMGKFWTHTAIENYLLSIKDAGLIHYFYQSGERYINFIGWLNHQTIQSDRAQLSKLPAFSEEKAKDASEFPDLSGSELDTERIQKVIGVDTQYNITKYNIKEFNEKVGKLHGILKHTRIEPKQPSDLRISKLFKYFKDHTYQKKGFNPEINWGRDGYLLKLRLGKYSEDQLKDLIDSFLNSNTSEELSCSLSICLSSHVINKWLAGHLKSKPKVVKI